MGRAIFREAHLQIPEMQQFDARGEIVYSHVPLLEIHHCCEYRDHPCSFILQNICFLEYRNATATFITTDSITCSDGVLTNGAGAKITNLMRPTCAFLARQFNSFFALMLIRFLIFLRPRPYDQYIKWVKLFIAKSPTNLLSACESCPITYEATKCPTGSTCNVSAADFVNLTQNQRLPTHPSSKEKPYMSHIKINIRISGR